MAGSTVLLVTPWAGVGFAITDRRFKFYATVFNEGRHVRTDKPTRWIGVTDTRGFFIKTSELTTFFEVIKFQTEGLLVLKGLIASISQDSLTVTIEDTTGKYPAVADGYNSEVASYDALRPRRSDLKLFLHVERFYFDDTSGSVVQEFVPTPEGNMVLAPWEQTIALPATGIYRISIIAMPADQVYVDWAGTEGRLAGEEHLGWYLVDLSLLADTELFTKYRASEETIARAGLTGGCDKCHYEFVFLIRALASALAGSDLVAAARLYRDAKLYAC